MAVTFPEVLGDLTEARERFEADGVQYVARFEPDTVQAGSAVALLVYAQNVCDTAIRFSVAPTTHRTGMLGSGLLGSGSLKFDVSPDLLIVLSPGEAGTWRVPLGVPPGAAARTWDVTLTFKGEFEGGSRPQRVRPSKTACAPGYLASLLDDVVGLGVIPVTGTSYETRESRKSVFKLNIVRADDGQRDPPDLVPAWTSAWSQSDLTMLSAAQREVNSRRLHIVEELGSPALFEGLSQSVQGRLDGTGVMPFPGEALAFAKMLTYTVGLLMHDEESQNALLVPVYMHALRAGRSINRTIEAVSWSGLQHLVGIAATLSFAIIAKAVGRQPWSLEERRGVARYVAQCVEQRMSLPPEFLYLPLLLAALTVMPIRMYAEEDPVESFRLLGTAWHSRYEGTFKHDPELQELVYIFNEMARATVGQMLPAKK